MSAEAKDASARVVILPRPSWALAYVSQKWKTKRTVSKAYRLAAADDNIADLSQRPSDAVFDAVREARDELAASVRALDSVLTDWDATRADSSSSAPSGVSVEGQG